MLARRVAEGLGLATLPPVPPAAVAAQDLPLSPPLQIIGKMKPTLQGRCVGLLIDEGSDAAAVRALRKAAEAAGARVKIVASRIGGAKLSDGKVLAADVQLAGSPSLVFDAVALVLTDKAGQRLAWEAAAVDFVRDAYGHLKAIAADRGGRLVLDAAGVEPDEGVVEAANTHGFVAAAKLRQWARESRIRTLA